VGDVEKIEQAFSELVDGVCSCSELTDWASNGLDSEEGTIHRGLDDDSLLYHGRESTVRSRRGSGP
jgi:hypothetical protein